MSRYHRPARQAGVTRGCSARTLVCLDRRMLEDCAKLGEAQKVFLSPSSFMKVVYDGTIERFVMLDDRRPLRGLPSDSDIAIIVNDPRGADEKVAISPSTFATWELA